MTSRLTALLVWGLAAASAVFWALRLVGNATPVPAQAQLAVPGGLPAGDLGRLLGTPAAPAAVAQQVQAAASTRFVLTGVVSTRAAAGPGVALLAVDGKPVRAYRVGQAVDDQLVLRAVGLRSARIGGTDGSGEFVLELPRPTPAATGVPGGAAVPVGEAPPELRLPPVPPQGAPPAPASMLPPTGLPPAPGMVPPGMAPPGMAPPTMVAPPGPAPQGPPQLQRGEATR